MLYQLSYGGDHSDRLAFRRPTRSGAEGNRTPDLSVANAALSQLSYGPSLPVVDDFQSGWAREDSNL